MPVKLRNETLYTCPKRPFFDNPSWFSDIIGYYRHYKNGFLPVQGSLEEQPDRLMSLISVLDSTIDECKSEQMSGTPVQEQPKGNPFADEMSKGKGKNGRSK